MIKLEDASNLPDSPVNDDPCALKSTRVHETRHRRSFRRSEVEKLLLKAVLAEAGQPYRDDRATMTVGCEGGAGYIGDLPYHNIVVEVVVPESFY